MKPWLLALLVVGCVHAPPTTWLNDPGAVVLRIANPYADTVAMHLSANGVNLPVGVIGPRGFQTFSIPGAWLKGVSQFVVFATDYHTGVILSTSDFIERNVGEPTVVTGRTTNPPAPDGIPRS